MQDKDRVIKVERSLEFSSTVRLRVVVLVVDEKEPLIIMAEDNNGRKIMKLSPQATSSESA